MITKHDIFIELVKLGITEDTDELPPVRTFVNAIIDGYPPHVRNHFYQWFHTEHQGTSIWDDNFSLRYLIKEWIEYKREYLEYHR